VITLALLAGFVLLFYGNIDWEADPEAQKELERLEEESEITEPEIQYETTRVAIASEPAGARVVVNGALVEGTTPDTFPIVLEQTNEILLFADGFETHRATAFGARDANPVRASLEPLPEGDKKARVELDSRPQGAIVFFDGVQVGTTPMVLQDVSRSTEHHLLLRKKGYYDHVAVARFAATDLHSVDAELKSRESSSAKLYVDLELEAVPRGTGVYIDDELVGATPLSERADRGTFFEVRFDSDTHREMTRRLALDQAGTIVLRPFLEEADLPTGRISIDTTPDAEIFLENSSRGGRVRGMTLPEGTYPVVFQTEAGARHEVRLEVSADEHARYRIDLSGDKPSIDKK
jgi:hypothetical protein